ncbi:MAG: tyrS [Actinomycetia bacterium]|nr:tyrS [Actinomycetes bacterium]
MTTPSADEQIRVLSAGAADVISPADLRKKLERGTPLRVKLGIDPTRPDIHLGFAVVLRKLRQFQDLGHTAVLIIGDFTAQVGDPSGRSATRALLSSEEAEANAQSYFDQVKLILRDDRLEVRRNSEWLGKMGIADVTALMARMTVARLLERDDFAKRYAGGAPISLLEFLYPLLQGWDSVVVEADVELGGTDQLFNNLVGRQLQQQEGQEPQVVLTMPILEGLDGVQKMSKSLDNYVGIAEPAAEQFGKIMSITDELMPRYFELTTGWHPDRVGETLAELADGRLRPVDAKRLLARTVVELYHGEGAGTAAETAFDQVFRAGGAPDEVPERLVPEAEFAGGPVRVARVLALAGLVSSNKEGRRMIEQGAVRIDGERVDDPDATVGKSEVSGGIWQVGKRQWARVRVE